MRAGANGWDGGRGRAARCLHSRLRLLPLPPASHPPLVPFPLSTSLFPLQELQATLIPAAKKFERPEAWVGHAGAERGLAAAARLQAAVAAAHLAGARGVAEACLADLAEGAEAGDGGQGMASD